MKIRWFKTMTPWELGIGYSGGGRTVNDDGDILEIPHEFYVMLGDRTLTFDFSKEPEGPTAQEVGNAWASIHATKFQEFLRTRAKDAFKPRT